MVRAGVPILREQAMEIRSDLESPPPPPLLLLLALVVVAELARRTFVTVTKVVAVD